MVGAHAEAMWLSENSGNHSKKISEANFELERVEEDETTKDITIEDLSK